MCIFVDIENSLSLITNQIYYNGFFDYKHPIGDSESRNPFIARLRKTNQINGSAMM
jgi:hypothetical protein